MYLITVIPLTKSKVAATLTYFTGNEIPLGAVVTVPLRSKNIHAIVTECRPAEDLKAEIKRASFQIRKLNKVNATVFFPKAFIETCRDLAEYYATSVGAVIDSLVSDSLLSNLHKIAPALPMQTSFNIGTSAVDDVSAKMINDSYTVQGDDGDRVSSWRSLIRSQFARKKSLAIYLPTIDEAEKMLAALQKGVEDYIFLLHGSLTAKQVAETWEKIASTAHPVVIVATGSFSVLPRGDIETVIIERENARGWVSLKRPYLDLRKALESIARMQKQTVYLADCLLRSETLCRLEKHEISEGTPFKWRSVSDARDILVDMRTRATAADNSSAETRARSAQVSSEELSPTVASASLTEKFRALSPELEELIQHNQEDSTHLFIFTLRRGHSPMTVCSDCQTIVTCRNCSAPVVLYASEKTGRNYFMCQKCGERRSADENCTQCGGWRLTPLGIGIDRVAEEIRQKFPDIDIFQIDADSTKNEKKVSEAVNAWRTKPGSILLGTEMAIPEINSKVEHIAIISLDSLFALPDFRINEKIMYTIVRLRAAATRTILVQTRKAEEKVFDYALKGNLSDFSRQTLDERKKFHYPPYAVLIKITCEGAREEIAAQMSEIQKLLSPHELEIFPAFTSTVRGKSLIHGLLRLDPKAWPDERLITILRGLPPSVYVKINPESLL